MSSEVPSASKEVKSKTRRTSMQSKWLSTILVRSAVIFGVSAKSDASGPQPTRSEPATSAIAETMCQIDRTGIWPHEEFGT